MEYLKKFLKDTGLILRNAKDNFKQNEPIIYSAAIAFFAIFSIPALLIVLTLSGTLFFSEAAVKQQIIMMVKELISRDASNQVRTVLDNVLKSPASFWEILIAVVVVLKGASIIFFIMQKALNAVWQVKVKPGVKYLTFMRYRLGTLAIVAGLGLLLVLSLFLDTVMAAYSEELYQLFEEFFSPAVKTVNTLFYLLVILSFFTAIHKILPDASVAWKDALAGGVITSALFLVGKQVINFILTNVKVVGIYAAAGSLVVVLLWIFYSSVILMLGAEVTRAYADFYKREVRPNPIAVRYKKINPKEG